MRNKFFTILAAAALVLPMAACQKANSNIAKDAPSQDNPVTGVKLSVMAAPALGTLIDSGIYRIRGLASLPFGPVVEITGASTAENQQAQQWPWFPNNGQKWKLIKTDATYYKLVSVSSNKCLQSPSSTSGDILRQHTDDGTDSERWSIAYSSTNDAYTLTNKATGMHMVVDPNDAVNGRKIRQKMPVTGTQDMFQFRNLNFQEPLMTTSRPDPFVAQKDGFYYFLNTKGNKITMIKTPAMSLVNAYPEITVYTPPAGTNHSSNLWAPELHFLSGKWYIYYSADDNVSDNHRMFVLENANIDPTTGTWTDKGKISDTADQWAADETVLTIGSTNYLVWSGWQDVATRLKQYLYIAPMTNPWTISGTRVQISAPTNTWEKHEPNSIGAGVNEGPIALQKDASSPIFIIYSASRYSSDDYCLGQIQLTSGGDPTVAANWINKKQVFTRNDANSVYGPGHNGFFTSSYTDGNGTFHEENWLVYHARTTPNTPSGGRPPRMQKFTWNADGSPNFGTALGAGVNIPIPIGD